MRGGEDQTGALFSYVDLEARVPTMHPLRTIRGIVDAALVELSPTFSGLYARMGRPSVPPEQLLRATLRRGSWRSCSTDRRCGGCCRASTSASTAR